MLNTNFKGKAAAVAIALGVISAPVHADTTTDTVTVFSGLDRILQITCTDLEFGLWSLTNGLATETIGAIPRIRVTAANAQSNNSATAHVVANLQSARRIALAGGLNFSPKVARCIITGSNLLPDTRPADINVINDSNTNRLMPSALGPYAAIGAAATANGMKFTVEATTPTRVSNRTSVCYVQGEFDLPELIERDVMGSYRAQTPIEVVYTDIGSWDQD